MIVRTKLLQISGSHGLPHTLKIDQTIASSQAHELMVARPFPLPRVFHCSSPNHVQIDIGQTSPEMEAILDHGCVEAIFPKSAVAIAPLIIIWVNDTLLSLLICAWIVSFFPILSNTILGLNSADHNLVNLFQLYRASRWQTLIYLRLPAALPYFLGGLRISGGLALIGAVVAEFVAGSGGTASGLAFRILEAGYQLKIPRMFAALVMLSIFGLSIWYVTATVQRLLLRRWHESEVKQEN